MVERQQIFGVPTYRWLPARGRVTVEYAIVCRRSDAIPEDLAPPA